VPNFIEPPMSHRCNPAAVAAVRDVVEQRAELDRLRTERDAAIARAEKAEADASYCRGVADGALERAQKLEAEQRDRDEAIVRAEKAEAALRLCADAQVIAREWMKAERYDAIFRAIHGAVVNGGGASPGGADSLPDAVREMVRAKADALDEAQAIARRWHEHVRLSTQRAVAGLHRPEVHAYQADAAIIASWPKTGGAQ
jgi:hypothetical protein